MKFLSTILLFSILIFTNCNKKNISTEPKPIKLTEKTSELVKAGNKFGFELLKKTVQQNEENKNLMISPLSVNLCMTMAYNGAESSTKAAFDSVFYFDNFSRKEVDNSFKELTDALFDVDKQVAFEIANSIWIHNELNVKKSFINTNQNYLDAEVKIIDFNDQNNVKIINNWVKTKTHNKISKIIDQLNPNELMALINAIYFNGTWRYNFKKSNTYKENFHKTDGTVTQVDMMSSHKSSSLYGYYSDDNLKLLEMPYGRGNFTMVIILPDENKNLNELITELTPEKWNQWLNQSYEINNIAVKIPKFEFHYKLSLINILKMLGLEEAFSDNADFSGITDDTFLKINRVIHKTYIKTDEKGTEAAAVTYVGIVTTSIDEDQLEFVADRPFFFAIREKYTGSIIFTGIVNDPNQHEE